jgi:hypothetical protein
MRGLQYQKIVTAICQKASHLNAMSAYRRPRNEPNAGTTVQTLLF